MKKIFYVFLVALISVFSINAQNNYTDKEHTFSRSIVFTAEGGATYTFTDFNTSEFDFIGRGSFEYFFPSKSIGAFGLKFLGGLGNLKGKDGYGSSNNQLNFKTETIFAGGGIVYALSLGKVVHPYLFAGASYLSYEPKISDPTDPSALSTRSIKKSTVNYNGEVGFRFMLTEFLSLNLSGGIHIVGIDQLDGLIDLGKADDIFYSFVAGFSLYYSTKPKDSDGDGVPDSEDLCPQNPQGIEVDPFGCPKDTDKDGVPDYLDQCPDTPPNVLTDNTGCPIDSDSDKIPDYLDKCPDTPINVAVDLNGCPLDSDNDSVPDYLDQCPDTKAGVKVDDFGCEIIEIPEEPEIPEVKVAVLSGSANFAYGKAELTTIAKIELNKLITVMKDFPETKWRIEGHTDNKGSYKANKRMSQKRANAVLNYFTENGLNDSRFEIAGLGPDFPVADNSTENGRALNRRVKIVLIEKEKVPEEKTEDIDKKYDPSKEKVASGTIFTDGNLFVVQVSSWKGEGKANEQVEKLKSQGHNAFIVEAYVPQKQGTWYRVRVGFFNSLEEAKAYQSKLK
jgi:OOP family OmpA-OmpF porin